MSCGHWKDTIEKHVTWWQIFSEEGKAITPTLAATQNFCHFRCLISSKGAGGKELVDALAALMQCIANTPSESMALNINDDYTFYEVVIS